jgi:hypothetical protein
MFSREITSRLEGVGVNVRPMIEVGGTVRVGIGEEAGSEE